MEEFKASFDLFDADGSGSIDTEELGKLMRAFGQVTCFLCSVLSVTFSAWVFLDSDLSGFQIVQKLDDTELQEMVEEVDADGTGVIEFDEFVKMITLKMERNMMNDEAQA